MPQVQTVDLTENKPEPTGVEQFFSKLSKSYKDQTDQNTLDTLISEYQGNREKANAWEDLQLNLEKSTIAPTKRLAAQSSLNSIKKNVIDEQKALNAKFRAHALTSEEREVQKQNLIKTGMPEWEADVYLDAPASVKNRIEANHIEEVKRERRSPLPTQKAEKDLEGETQEAVPPQETVTEAPGSNKTTAESLQTIEPAIAQPETSNAEKPQLETREVPQVAQQAPVEAPQAAPVPPQAPPTPQPPKPAATVPTQEEWPVIPPLKGVTPAEREKDRASNQKENSKVVQENDKKVKAIRDDKTLISNMQKLNDSGKLPSGGEKWITVDPETGDVRAVAKLSDTLNPETQAYIKDINKFVKHAKDYFGARVTNFDLQAFMSQLPTLSNTTEGRRLILQQMQLDAQLSGLYANTLDEAIKHYKGNANIIDIMKVTDDKIKSEQENIIRKMDLSVDASNYTTKMIQNPEKFKGTVLYEKDGKFKAVPAAQEQIAQQRGWSKY